MGGFMHGIYIKSMVSFLRVTTRLQYGSFPNSPDTVIHIQSRDPGRTIKAHVYWSLQAKKSSAGEAQSTSNLLINIHGSGFILPIHGSDDAFCRQIATNTSYTVLDVQYRLAPEFPFPAALEDVEDIVRFVMEGKEGGGPGIDEAQQHVFRAENKNIAVSGFSAGGTLALAAAHSIKRNSAGVAQSSTSTQPAHQTMTTSPSIFNAVLAFYPITDMSIPSGSKRTPDPKNSSNGIPAVMLNVFRDAYVPSETESGTGGTSATLKGPRFSPSFANASDYPRNTLMVTCELDNLAPEAEALADKIESAGNGRVTRYRVPSMRHAWDKTAKKPEEKKEVETAYALAEKVLEEAAASLKP